MERQSGYFSYLLRIWQSGPVKAATWRASLECPLTGERRTFASLEDLWIFLQDQIATTQQEQTPNEASFQ